MRRMTRTRLPNGMPALADYLPPSNQNTAAISSLVCAILWLVCLAVRPVWNLVTHSGPIPGWVGTFTATGLLALASLGIICGLVGLVRSFTQPRLHGRWPAIIGLLFGLLWLVATPFL